MRDGGWRIEKTSCHCNREDDGHGWAVLYGDRMVRCLGCLRDATACEQRVVELERENANLKKHIADDRYCAAHGQEHCVPCEGRCESCGYDALEEDMVTTADGERLCRDCAAVDDENEESSEEDDASDVLSIAAQESLDRGVADGNAGRVSALAAPYEYAIEVDREEDGRWIADIPSLPGVVCYGETREQAIEAARQLAQQVLADRAELLDLEDGKTERRKDGKTSSR